MYANHGFSQIHLPTNKVRNSNDFMNDTFYHKKRDTIYKAIIYAETKEYKILLVYHLFDKTWISEYNADSIKEEGYFVKQKHGIRYIFRKKKYQTYLKIDEWKYYDKGGNVIRTENFNRSQKHFFSIYFF